mgnify:CR=1 FL=1
MRHPEESDPFADIRPYNDAEVPAVIARLARDPALAAALALLRLPRLAAHWPWLSRHIVQLWLRQQARRVQTVADFQTLVAPQLASVIERTSRFTVGGLAALDSTQSYVFVSNHRDIAMDPAYANYALNQAGHRTASIAIGNNLLKQPWVADVMRLNKSFIVRRDLKGPRELLAASKQLAGFIRHMIAGNKGSIWIAQREGRAKTGVDATEPAVIKMLALSRDKGEDVGEVLRSLQIVPLSISYELDPCDAMKAAELAAGPGYTKAEDEDVASIGRGIAGQKGCVHLQFGTPITADAVNVEAAVAEINRQIIEHYALFPSNVWAWERLNGVPLEGLAVYRHSGSLASQAMFDARINALPIEHQKLVLTMYANPVNSMLAHNLKVK